MLRLMRGWIASLFMYAVAPVVGGDPPAAPPPAPSAAPPAAPGAGDPPAAPPAAGDPPAPPPADGKNWREDFGGGDPRKIEKLSRYATPNAVVDALLSVQERISKAELRSNVPFPDKGTDAEKAAWRAEQGIPAAPDKYELKLAEGRTIDEKSKPHIDAFVGKLHGVNAPPAVVNAALNAYYDEVEATTNARIEKDNQDVQATRDSLIAEMGLPEFKANYNLVMGMFESMPSAAKDNFMRGRLADGSPILGNVEVFKGLAGWARTINPAAALVPGNSGSPDAIETEIGKIEKLMRDDRTAYNKDNKLQERYRQLIEARDRANPQKK